MSRDPASVEERDLPRWVRRCLGSILRGEHHRATLDELRELHALRRSRLGERAARRRLRREVARLALHTLAARLRTGRRGRSAAAALGLDVRYAWRSLRRDLRFSATAILTLAVAVAATAATLTVTKGVLVDPLPYSDGDRLAIVWSELPGAGYDRAPISGPELDDLRRRSRHFDAFASIWTTTAALVEEDRPETVRLAMVTWNFLSLFSTEPLLGRGFEAADEGPGVAGRVLLSEGLWHRRFGGDPGVLGRSLRLDGGWGFRGGVYTVVGVVPDSFRLILPPDAGVATDPDVWVPLPFDVASAARGQYFLRTVGRRAPGIDFELAAAEIRQIGTDIAKEHAEYAAGGRAFDALPLREDTVRGMRPTLLALLGGAGLLLLIAWSNVASLLVARALDRRQELLMRSALGASQAQIAARLLVDSLLLAAVGGLAGLLLGWQALRLLPRVVPSELPRIAEVGLDADSFLLALGTCGACGVLFGLLPMLVARRFAAPDGLRVAARTVPGAGRSRDLLVAGQLALVFVLSVAALLCLQTVRRLQQQPLGFEADGVLTFELTLPGERYGSEERLAPLAREIDRQLAQIPGAVAAGAINQLPLSDLPNWSTPYRLLGTATDGETVDEPREADGRVVTPGYFAAVRAELLEGRLFDLRDDATSRPVVIVDERLAAKAWPGDSAVGKEIEIDVRRSNGFVATRAVVVGTIGHLRHHDPRREVREQIFVPFSQGARNQMAVAIRSSGDPRALIAGARQRLRELDPELALSRIRLLEEYVADSTSRERFTLTLAGLFATVALLLGGVGLYGVVSVLVIQRRREIGLRLALGSPTASVARVVVGRGLLLIAHGLVAGLAMVLVARQVLSSLAFGVSPVDPRILLLVSVMLGLVGLLACWAPVRRALRVDPAVVLRGD